MSDLFTRFTERARQVVTLAQDEARGLKHNYIGTEHILLGLVREEEGLAARVLRELHISADHVRDQITHRIGPGDEAMEGKLPFTPRGKKVLELGLREALSLGHNYVGTEHILLGLVRENEGVAAEIMRDADAPPDKVRNEVIRWLSGPRPRTVITDPPKSYTEDELRRICRILLTLHADETGDPVALALRLAEST